MIWSVCFFFPPSCDLVLVVFFFGGFFYNCFVVFWFLNRRVLLVWISYSIAASVMAVLAVVCGRDLRVIGLVLLLSMFLAMPSPLASAGELHGVFDLLSPSPSYLSTVACACPIDCFVFRGRFEVQFPARVVNQIFEMNCLELLPLFMPPSNSTIDL